MTNASVVGTITEDRATFLGASEIGAVVGWDPHKSALDLYAEKVGLVPPFAGNQHTERGTELEAAAVKKWLSLPGNEQIQVVRVNRRWQHPVYPFIAGKIDRRVVGVPEIIEVKCPSLGSYHKIKREGLHGGYIAQMQMYLGLTGSTRGTWVIFCADQWEVLAFPMEFDSQVYTNLVDCAVSFWQDHVVPRVPPLPSNVDEDRTDIDLAGAAGEYAILDVSKEPEFVASLSMYAEAKMILDEGTHLMKAARERVLEGISTMTSGRNPKAIYAAPGYRLSYSVAKGRGSLDRKALENAKLLDRITVATALQRELDRYDPDERLNIARIVVAEAAVNLNQFTTPGQAYPVLRLTTSGD